MKKYLTGSVLLLSSCYNCETINQEEKPLHLVAQIDTLYRDLKNRNIPTIKLKFIKTNMKIQWLDGSELFGLYENGEKGDTVIKEANSLAYKLIKKDTVMVFYPICEGKEIR